MEFFYQAGAMGYFGEGWFWHKLLPGEFKSFPFVTKSITLNPKIGYPFAILRMGQSTWNKISLNNMGFYMWVNHYIKVYNKISKYPILSLYGDDSEFETMITFLESHKLPLSGIELNYSCPNACSIKSCKLPTTKYKLYIKLRYDQDPYKFDLDIIECIHLNTVPLYRGGIGGKIAQKYNWKYISKFSKEGVPIAGSSWTSYNDLKRLQDMGCTTFGIGSIIITRPQWVKTLN